RILILQPGGRVSHDCTPGSLTSRYGTELTEAGVWLAGVAPPTPVEVPAELVAPEEAGPAVGLRGVGVDLVTRRLRGSITTAALHRLDAKIPSGVLTAVVGPSGSGKSTLL